MGWVFSKEARPKSVAAAAAGNNGEQSKPEKRKSAWQSMFGSSSSPSNSKRASKTPQTAGPRTFLDKKGKNTLFLYFVALFIVACVGLLANTAVYLPKLDFEYVCMLGIGAYGKVAGVRLKKSTIDLFGE